MKTRYSWFFLLLLAGCQNCDKTAASLAPESLDGKTLHATVTLGTGSFADLGDGYTFNTTLLKDHTFRTTSVNNTSDSEGNFTYTRTGNTSAILKLTDNSELHKGETLEVSLNFTSSKLGTYSVQVLSGPGGEQNGTFELR
jgi:hypothetical protein